jgi:hypothetical protein
MVTIEETNVTRGVLTVRLSDGHTMTIAPHDDRIFVGVSGLGQRGTIKAVQGAANNLSIHYEQYLEKKCPQCYQGHLPENCPGP